MMTGADEVRRKLGVPVESRQPGPSGRIGAIAKKYGTDVTAAARKEPRPQRDIWAFLRWIRSRPLAPGARLVVLREDRRELEDCGEVIPPANKGVRP